MSTIYKYEIPVDDRAHEFNIPGLVEFSKTAFSAGERAVWIWAVCNPGYISTKCLLRVFGTGHEIPYSAILIATAPPTPENAGFVWHVFEVSR